MPLLREAWKDELMICNGRTLLNSSKDMVVRTEDAVEHTVSGRVVTVVLEDTENDGVTTTCPRWDNDAALSDLGFLCE